MSDRETIIATVSRAHSRIRRHRLAERMGSVACAFVLVAILIKLSGLFVLLGAGFLSVFWTVWFAALLAFLIRAVRTPGDLIETARDLDRRAHLNDEVLSAYWFLNQKITTPWVELQIQRAARTARQVDLGKLYPRALPKTSIAAACGVVLLVALNFAPIPFTPNLLFSTPVPDLEALDRQARLNAIDALLAEAEAMNPDAQLAIGQFQQLVQDMRNADLSLALTEDQAQQVDGVLDEGNLNMNSLLEGLEEIGEDLQRSEETASAGEALSQGNIDAAAEEFERLAEALASGSEMSSDLQQALEEAADSSRAGLEELAEALAAAAEAMANPDSQAAEESLMDAAETLGQISDMIESQQLQNQAAQQMQDLREALEQLERQQSQQADQGGSGEQNPSDGGDPGPQQEAGAEGGEAGEGTPQEGEGGTPQEGFQPGSTEGAAEFVPGQAPEGAQSDPTAPPTTGDLQNLEPTGTGDIPSGLGFSPAQKTGAPTSLEVQLQLQTTTALGAADLPAPDPARREEATRQELSTLDYRNVPSELAPAQQELLNQERIPRTYQNVIKEYFQAIRPPK